jgi:hypothetical protein
VGICYRICTSNTALLLHSSLIHIQEDCILISSGNHFEIGYKTRVEYSGFSQYYMTLQEKDAKAALAAQEVQAIEDAKVAQVAIPPTPLHPPAVYTSPISSSRSPGSPLQLRSRVIVQPSPAFRATPPVADPLGQAFKIAELEAALKSTTSAHSKELDTWRQKYHIAKEEAISNMKALVDKTEEAAEAIRLLESKGLHA